MAFEPEDGPKAEMTTDDHIKRISYEVHFLYMVALVTAALTIVAYAYLFLQYQNSVKAQQQLIQDYQRQLVIDAGTGY